MTTIITADVCLDNNNNKNNNYNIATWLEWKITWIRSFPTLLPWILLYRNDEDDDDDDDDMSRLWQQMAFDEIFSNDSVNVIKDKNNRSKNKRIKNHDAVTIMESKETTSTSDFACCSKQRLNVAADDRRPLVATDDWRDVSSIYNHQKLLRTTMTTTKKNMNHDCGSLGYGEITASAVFRVISWIRRDQQQQQQRSGDKNHLRRTSNNYWSYQSHPSVVLDMGSGNGKVLMASALAFPFTRAIGFEIVDELHQEALMNLSQWNRYHHVPYGKEHHSTTTTTTAPTRAAATSTGTVFDLYHADLRHCCRDQDGRASQASDDNNNNNNNDWLRHVRLVWVHATVFDDH